MSFLMKITSLFQIPITLLLSLIMFLFSLMAVILISLLLIKSLSLPQVTLPLILLLPPPLLLLRHHVHHLHLHQLIPWSPDRVLVLLNLSRSSISRPLLTSLRFLNPLLKSYVIPIGNLQWMLVCLVSPQITHRILSPLLLVPIFLVVVGFIVTILTTRVILIAIKIALLLKVSHNFLVWTLTTPLALLLNMLLIIPYLAFQSPNDGPLTSLMSKMLSVMVISPRRST